MGHIKRESWAPGNTETGLSPKRSLDLSRIAHLSSMRREESTTGVVSLDMDGDQTQGCRQHHRAVHIGNFTLGVRSMFEKSNRYNLAEASSDIVHSKLVWYRMKVR